MKYRMKLAMMWRAGERAEAQESVVGRGQKRDGL